MKFLRTGLLFSILCFIGTDLCSQNIETLVLRPGPEDGYDAEIRTDVGYPIWDNDDFIANAWTTGGNFFIQRSLMKFDLSSIPPGSVITNARLSLFCNTNTGHHQLHSGENSSYLLRITTEWDQYQVIWDNQPATTMVGAVILPQSDYQTQDYPNIDVTEFVRYFYQYPEMNYGFMIQLIEEELYRAMIFGSSNHLDVSKRPILEIDYYPCIVPDTSFSYSFDDDFKTANFELDQDPDTQYWWNFGNGFYSDLPEPIFTFQETGQYNVCLTASNSCDTLMNCKTVVVCDLNQSEFLYQVNGNQVSFSSLINLPEVEYLWDFGDGFFSYLADPVHIYNSAGQYNVCLTISNDCNIVQSCDTVVILVTGPEIYSNDRFISVFPNPGKGSFKIRKDEREICFNNIKVINNNGRVVLNIEESSIVSHNDIVDIDLSSHTSGVYMLLIETEKGVICRELILMN